MNRVKTNHRKKAMIIGCLSILVLTMLMFRVSYLMIFKADFLQEKAKELHNRERKIKAKRGIIYDRTGIPLATNQSVTSISVIHNQITNKDKVIETLSKELGLEYDYIKKKVDKVVALERIKANVDIEIANRIREQNLNGVIIDEDYRRVYPFSNIASHVLGFVGSDSQGIIGLEVKYEEYLKGKNGMIYMLTNAKGIELENSGEGRKEPEDGNNLIISLDINIQQYAEQALEKVLISKNAKRGSLIVMNPQNGEIYAMVNKPDFDLNDPFYVENTNLSAKDKEIVLNKKWRNYCINDTYEPGSTFKIVTASAGLEEGVVHLEDRFFCPGYAIVGDRRIRCHKAGGHGSQTFVEGVRNSCNPVFMATAERLGVKKYLEYYRKFGLSEKTGIDLPGEAIGIMHKEENIGPVELATISFGQSFQITPLQLVRTGASIVNGGKLVTPHFGLAVSDENGNIVKKLEYDNSKRSIAKHTSDTMRSILESVVAEGTGRRCYIPGYKVGGKTATSEKLPRRSKKYISSFLGFAPANDPQVIALVLIDEPVGIYYGGTVAAPVIKEVFENILPYLGIEPNYSKLDFEKYNVGNIVTPNCVKKEIKEVKTILKELELEVDILGEGDYVKEQFPLAGEKVNKGSKIILYAN
jgi:stage V sporulation protein D (sporulation-specific penicillin-binding protein)